MISWRLGTLDWIIPVIQCELLNVKPAIWVNLERWELKYFQYADSKAKDKC